MTVKTLLQLGASFRCATAMERKHLAFDIHAADSLHRQISAHLPNAEFCMISTCNRAEFYAFADCTSEEIRKVLHRCISPLCPPFQELLQANKITHRRNSDAFVHLLRVACGLDSHILGDTQIVGQIREALACARESKTSGAYVERAVGAALNLGGRVRSQTSISAGSAGISAAICDSIESSLQLHSCENGKHALSNDHCTAAPRILILGAGAIGGGVARLLASRGLRETTTIVNRHPERAQLSAAKYGVHAGDWSDFSRYLAEADVIVAATGAREPILDRTQLRWLERQHSDSRHILLIDAGMPPNIEECPSERLTIIGIDQLQARQDAIYDQRQTAVPTIELRIEEELNAWHDWLAERPLENLLKSLYLDVGRLPDRLVDRGAEAWSDSSENLRYVIKREIKQLLHPHVHDLRRLMHQSRKSVHLWE